MRKLIIKVVKITLIFVAIMLPHHESTSNFFHIAFYLHTVQDNFKLILLFTERTFILLRHKYVCIHIRAYFLNDIYWKGFTEKSILMYVFMEPSQRNLPKMFLQQLFKCPISVGVLFLHTRSVVRGRCWILKWQAPVRNSHKNLSHSIG